MSRSVAKSRSGCRLVIAVDLYANMAYRHAEAKEVTMPRSSAEAKRERMHLRLDSAAKRKLARAAAYQNASVSDFVLVHAVAAAERVIEAHEKVTLSATDWDVFYEALVNPPKPNEKLKEAVRRYRERVGE